MNPDHRATGALPFARRAFLLAFALAVTVPVALWSATASAQLRSRPSSSSTPVLAHPTLRWADTLDNETEYEIEVATDPEFAGVIDRDLITLVPRYIPSAVLPSGRYWWRVRSRVSREAASGVWHRAGHFEVAEPSRVFSITAGSDLVAIHGALNAAAATPGSVVRFEPGEYVIAPGRGRALLEITDARSVTVEAAGARFTFAARGSIARIRGSTGVLIHGLEADFDPLPFSGGEITTIDAAAGTFDIELLPGHPSPTDDPLISQHGIGMLADLDIPGVARGSPVVLRTRTGWESLGGRRYRVALVDEADTRYLHAGLVYIDSPRAGDAGFDLADSSDVTLSSVTTYAIAGIGVSSHYVDDLKLMNVHFLRRDGRVLGVQNGGTNLHNGREGPWVEGCVFENTGDDNNHINALVMHATDQPTPDSVVVPRRQFYHVAAPDDLGLRIGDRLMFFYREPVARQLGVRRVTAITPTTASGVPCLRLTLDAPLDAFEHADIQKWNNPDIDRLGRDEVQIYNLDQSSPGYVFRDNRFSGGRRIGILTKGGPGLIERNEFRNLGAAGIEAWNAPLEGPLVDRLVIQNNLFDRCGVTSNRQNQAFAIWFIVFDAPGRSQQLHRRILIRGNTIRDYRDRGIALLGVNGARIVENRFESIHLDAFDGASPAAIHVMNSRNVLIGEQIYNDARLHDGNRVRID